MEIECHYKPFTGNMFMTDFSKEPVHAVTPEKKPPGNFRKNCFSDSYKPMLNGKQSLSPRSEARLINTFAKSYQDLKSAGISLSFEDDYRKDPEAQNFCAAKGNSPAFVIESFQPEISDLQSNEVAIVTSSNCFENSNSEIFSSFSYSDTESDDLFSEFLSSFSPDTVPKSTSYPDFLLGSFPSSPRVSPIDFTASHFADGDWFAEIDTTRPDMSSNGIEALTNNAMNAVVYDCELPKPKQEEGPATKKQKTTKPKAKTSTSSDPSLIPPKDSITGVKRKKSNNKLPRVEPHADIHSSYQTRIIAAMSAQPQQPALMAIHAPLLTSTDSTFAKMHKAIARYLTSEGDIGRQHLSIIDAMNLQHELAIFFTKAVNLFSDANEGIDIKLFEEEEKDFLDKVLSEFVNQKMLTMPLLSFHPVAMQAPPRQHVYMPTAAVTAVPVKTGCMAAAPSRQMMMSSMSISAVSSLSQPFVGSAMQLYGDESTPSPRPSSSMQVSSSIIAAMHSSKEFEETKLARHKALLAKKGLIPMKEGKTGFLPSFSQVDLTLPSR